MGNPRYSIMKNLEDVDCLRVEIDDCVTNTTSVTHIPIYDIEKAIAQYKFDHYAPNDQKVRITSPDYTDITSLIGWKVNACDAETGEELKNITRAVITLDAERLNMVELTRCDFSKRFQEPRTETLIMENPEVDITALVTEKG